MNTEDDKNPIALLELAILQTQRVSRLVEIYYRWPTMSKWERFCARVLVRWLRLKLYFKAGSHD